MSFGWVDLNLPNKILITLGIPIVILACISRIDYSTIILPFAMGLGWVFGRDFAAEAKYKNLNPQWVFAIFLWFGILGGGALYLLYRLLEKIGYCKYPKYCEYCGSKLWRGSKNCRFCRTKVKYPWGELTYQTFFAVCFLLTLLLIYSPPTSDDNTYTISFENTTETKTIETIVSVSTISTQQQIYEPLPTIEQPRSPANSNKIDTKLLETQVHVLINNYRSSNGIPQLKYDDILSTVARRHSTDMGQRLYFSHYSLISEESPTDRASSVGYTCIKNYGSYYTDGIGENIAQTWTFKDYTTYYFGNVYNYYTQEELADDIFQLWRTSPGHNQNMLDGDYDREGIGIYITDDQRVYVTEDLC